MEFDPKKHHRLSIRIPEYDYSQNGFYFITICTHEHKYLFGKIKKITSENYICALNTFGKIASTEWQRTEQMRPDINLDAFVVMPNHIHGIVEINITDKNKNHFQKEGFGRPTRNSIPTIIRAYKATVTRQINEVRKLSGVPVWHRNYYEHIIRNDKAYFRITEYIQNNPLKWEMDRFYQE